MLEPVSGRLRNPHGIPGGRTTLWYNAQENLHSSWRPRYAYAKIVERLLFSTSKLLRSLCLSYSSPRLTRWGKSTSWPLLLPICDLRMKWRSEWFSKPKMDGYAIIMEYREGEPLCDIWHSLNATERAHVQTECLKAIHALRAISIRLDDAGMHNVLYARESRMVTLLDFEFVAHLMPNASIPATYEMRKIFRSSLREHGG